MENGALYKLNDAIGAVEKDIDTTGDYAKREEISRLFYDFTIQNFPEYANLAYIINITSTIIKAHPRFAFDIITSFTQGYIDKNKNWEGIDYCISHIINKIGITNYQNLVPDIIDGFVKGCLMRKPDNREDIKKCFHNLLKRTGCEGKYNLKKIIDSFYDQYKSNLKGLKKEIKKIANEKISDDKKKKAIRNTFFYFILDNVQEKTKPERLIKTTSEIIKNNPKFAFAIIDAFTAGFICKGKNLEYIGDAISQIIQNNREINNQDLANNIIDGFVQGYLQKKGDDINNLTDEISKIIKENKKLASGISAGFTQGCFLHNQEWKDIDGRISQIIQNKGIEYSSNLVNDIINGFVQGYLQQKKDDINNLTDEISKIIKKNEKLALGISAGFTRGCFLHNQEWKDIGDAISQIIQNKGINNQELVNKIICGFVKGYLKQKKDDINNLTDEISKIIEKNKGLALGISGGFTQGCFLHNQEWKDIDSRISQIIKNNGRKDNSDLVNDIINGFTQSCILKERELKDIGDAISNIINKNGIKNYPKVVYNIIRGFTQGCIYKNEKLGDIGDCISEIIKQNAINCDPKLVYNIIVGFIQGYLVKKPDNIKDIAENFSKLLDIDFGKQEAKIKEKLRLTLSSIASRYRDNISAYSDKKGIEDQIVECYKKIFNETDEEKINNFRLRLQRPYKSTNSSNEQLLGKDKQDKEDADYHSSQPSYPLSNIYAKSNKLSELEQKKDLNNGKPKYDSISNSAKENNIHSSKRPEQQKQQGNRTL